MMHQDLLLTQQTYRCLLAAMSRPGTVRSLPGQAARDPLLWIARTLLDQEVGCAIVGDSNGAIATLLASATRCRVCSVEDADFVIALNGQIGNEILKVRTGNAEYPDEGATIIYSIEAIDPSANGSSELRLSGPGINGWVVIHLSGFPVSEAAHIAALNKAFPLGVDIIFVDPQGTVACIPRSSCIEVAPWAM
jgi:alpha-D-ribose 1-methylphosphonate 5-triphosphate synthase subunit PhnH